MDELERRGYITTDINRMTKAYWLTEKGADIVVNLYEEQKKR
ncbi:MAG TPA: hypothetical protein P5277_02015 [Candidatus Paceibacterota bacterium]|nr:hypothetical protein [Candidatus Paceibacterota bacterium]